MLYKHWILGVALVGCSAPWAVMAEAIDVPQVTVAKLVKTEHYTEMVAPAQVQSESEIDIVAETGGFIQNRPGSLGQRVRQGQLLFSIKNPDPLAGFNVYNVISQSGGVISQVYVKEGERVQSNQKLLRLQSGNELKITARLSNYQAALIESVLSGFWIDAGGDIPLSILGLAKTLDPQSGTSSCDLKLADSKDVNRLRSGQIGRIKFRTNQRKAFSVPESSLFYRKNKPHIITLDAQNKASYLQVELVQSSQEAVEIKGELTEGLRYIVNSSTLISDQETVRVEGDKP